MHLRNENVAREGEFTGERVQGLYGEFTCALRPKWYFAVHKYTNCPFLLVMESLDDQSTASDSTSSLTDVPEGGKMNRIAAHTQGLFSDLREWIDLRIDLAILEVEERIDELKNEVALGVTFALFGFFAVLFSLTTVALGVGWLLGHPFWGFLAVSVALILVLAALRVTKPELMPPSNMLRTLREERARAYEDTDQPPRPASAAVGEDTADPETDQAAQT